MGASAGVNSIRTYHVPPEWFLAEADEGGITVLVDVPWPKHLCFLDSCKAMDEARKLFEDAVPDMRAAHAPPLVLGTVLYNLAIVRAQEGREDDAIDLLQEAIPMRPDIKNLAPDDKDLGDLRADPRFQELVRQP